MGFLLWSGRAPVELPGQDGWRIEESGQATGFCIDNRGVSQAYPEFIAQASNDNSGKQLLFLGKLMNPESISAMCGQQTASSDAELCLALLDLRGDAGLDLLEGNWSLCLLDTDGSILLARDRTGLYPLCYTHEKHACTVASDESLLIRHAGTARTEDRAWLAAWFAFHPPPPGRTAFENIAECPPGNLVRFSADGRISQRRLSARPCSLSKMPFEEAVGLYRQNLQDAVETALAGAERPCIMLSGGMDSLPVAAIASELLQRDGRRLQAVSWSLNRYPECDESAYIRDAAAFLNLPVHFVEGSHRFPFADPETVGVGLSSPHANAFHGLVESLYERAGVLESDLLLNAGFGDALFPYVNFLLADAVKRRDFDRFVREFRCIRQYSPDGLFRHWAVRRLLRELVGSHKAHRRTPPAWLSDEARALLGDSDWPPESNSMPHPDHYLEVFNGGMATERVRAAEWARGYGVIRRDPYNAPVLLDLMQQLPATFSWQCGTDKLIAREAVRGLLPEQLRRKQRTGLLDAFWTAGFRANSDVIRERLRQTESHWGAYIDPGAIFTELEVQKGSQHTMKIWRCLSYASWRERLQGLRD